MKIGLLTGEYPPMQGGVGDFSRKLAVALDELGHDAHVITGVGNNAQHSRRPTVHPIVTHWGWRSYDQVMELARHLFLDVLNIQYQAAAYDLHPAINFLPWRANCASARRKSLGRPKIIVTFHDLKVPYLFPKAGPLRDRVVTLLARRADAAIVTNKVDELAMTARGVRRIERIPIGSNIAPALPDNFDRDGWRARWGLPPDGFVLGFFGFFNARKGVDTLIRALAVLQAESPNYHLFFIGGTVGSSDATNRAYADQMEALIVDRALNDRVHYTGYVPAAEVSAAFGVVDLCVLPYADGFSFHHGTLMAALAHGQAIISTHPSVDLPELVHGENVWLVPPEDPDALANAISHLSFDAEYRQRLRQGAAELSAQFSWERIALRTADLFERLKREK